MENTKPFGRTRAFATVAAAALGVGLAASHAGAAIYSTVVLADNPVGYYRLGEASGAVAADSSTNNSAGAYFNVSATALGKPGIPGAGGNTAVLFDGMNDWVSTPAAGQIAGTDQTYTLEVWVNIGTADLTSARYAVSHLRDGQNNRYHALGIDASERGVMAQNQNGAVTTTGSTSLNDGNWHHLVGVFGSGNAANEDNFYIDGVFAGSANGPTEDGATSRFYIGLLHNSSSGTGYFSGLIDEAAVYNSQLSPARILAHYQAGISVPEPTGMALLGIGAIAVLRRRR